MKKMAQVNLWPFCARLIGKTLCQNDYEHGMNIVTTEKIL